MKNYEKFTCLCELMENPVGIDCIHPRFSWRSDAAADMQTGYRIRVSREEDLSQLVWDSRDVRSETNNLVPYEGEALESGTQYYYQVTVHGQKRDYTSEICTFFTGILEYVDWDQHWIGGAGVRNQSYLIRWPIKILKKVKQAAAFVVSPNYYLLYHNGELCGDSRLNNARTDYSKTLLYETYPLKLEIGENVLGIEIGNGWYSMEKGERGVAKGEHLAAVLVRVEYMDGEILWLGTDWENCFCTGEGPIQHNSIYTGETYDARKEQAGWNRPTFQMKKSNGWGKVFQQDSPGGVIRAQMMEPIRIMEELKPMSIYPAEDGRWMVDFGQNFAGWVRLKIKGERGEKITLRFAELVNSDGTLNEASLNGNRQEDCYIIRGEDEEIFEPRFTYHGFRYVEITGVSSMPAEDMVTGCVVHSGVKKIGDFETDHELLNRFYRSVLWTERSNLYGFPTDCPQRAERVGWLNDMTVRCECALYNYRLPSLYKKWMGDIRDTQGACTGAISDTAPFYRIGQKPADPVSSSYLLIPWEVYRFYGDTSILWENYEGCKRWAAYLERHSDGGIVRYCPMGDWASPKRWCDEESIGAGAVSKITPGEFVATGFQYYNYCLLGRMAAVLGKSEDEALFKKKSEQLKEIFLKKYYHEKEHYFAGGSQACNALPLYVGMLDNEEGRLVMKHLVRDVMETHQIHLTTGNLCSRYVVELLFQYGYVDEAFALLTQTSYPSWGYMLENGATTLWERWEKVETYEGISKMASHNHAMTGAVGVCFHKYLAGIRPDVNWPGFQNAIIRPVIPRQLKYVSGTLETVRGTYGCRWRFENENQLRIFIQVPFQCTADVYLPAGWCRGLAPAIQKKEEEGFPFVSADSLSRVVLDEGEFYHLRIGPGKHEFLMEASFAAMATPAACGK